MYNPGSTYRIQFHKGFTFRHLEAIIPYLEDIGIGTLYASPIFKAVPGSTHGYDGVDPLQINPEIGTLEELRQLSQQLKSRGIGWVQDIVPNHMAFHSDNAWLMDVLEKGPESKYYNYFDINHDRPLMVPFLGADLVQVIADGQLQIIKKAEQYSFIYGEHTWPLNQASYPKKELEKVNRDKAALQKIAGQQYYRLCSWQETDHRINYRRFFTVNGLICLNIQRPEVFDEFHLLIARLVQEGIFDGLRIDHIDGLYDPEKCLVQLRDLVGPETFIAVEKILEPGEAMPAWPVAGNTGYDFLGLVNNLLTNRKGEAELSGFYQTLTGETASVQEQVAVKKRHILTEYMGGEWENLTQLFVDLELGKISRNDLKQAIGEFLVACPVYRFYGNAFPLAQKEAEAIKNILAAIGSANPALSDATDVLEKVFGGAKNKTHREKALRFYQRCMQFTGPLMAKGVEDTLMYTDNHFIAHNEVGDSPEAAGMSVNQFHRAMADRQAHWPLAMNGTATHDTKRGEDVRARLQVLPDIAGEWLALVEVWQSRQKNLAITENDAYFIYQTLLGACPMPGVNAADFGDRLDQYLEKTLREGKQNSNWAEPNEAYESAAKDFGKQLLDQRKPFWKSFDPMQRRVAELGILNSLAQVLLKFTCPGVPDVYQGCEHWDLSLVDPDNRRPVDYELRKELLSDIKKSKSAKLPQLLWQNRLDGRIKIWLTRVLAMERKANPLVFTEGTYIPLTVAGKYKNQVMAFARQYQNLWYVVTLPLGAAALVKEADDLNGFDWEDTRIVLPDGVPDQAVDLLANNTIKIGHEICLNDLFKQVPFAFFKLSGPEKKRSAGILLSISSLPSPFGLGDFGPSARQFADLLHRCGQTYWQMLPLSPVSARQQYSPYSSYASMAGNEWYISPQLLVADGLLKPADLDQYILPESAAVDYAKVAAAKQKMIDKAWSNYQAGETGLAAPFQAFCKLEKGWLDDYALFAVLRKHHEGKPWYEWDEKYKMRDKQAIKLFVGKNAADMERSKWQQFIFNRQLRQLKQYCNRLGIQLFGDLPFYVSYDSADVWANPELFALDQDGGMEYVAGVPPDYFNADGQLWGMPVFNWPRHEAQNFDWWVRRIKKNLEYYDLLRLDHFRAFATYWAVPAKESTAINGSWEQAPGAALFKRLEQELGELPFVAEDLGDVDAAVYALRDQFGMPGMKVLQFAWGKDLPDSPHIPHNYSEKFVAYTGTHDNNTTRGWFRQDIDEATRKNLKRYTGVKISERNISKELIKIAFASVAATVIIPLQDWLNLGEAARMNIPAATQGNWIWRLTAEQLASLPEKKIRQVTVLFNR